MRDNLMVTMGARAAYMECKGLIELPSGVYGEANLAKFVADKVDHYIDNDIDECFDFYVEAALIEEYGVKQKGTTANKYVYNVIICDGLPCGEITIVAGNEDDAKKMAQCYVFDKLSEALPELDIYVSVELKDVYYG